MVDGYIKILRRIREWGWYHDPKTFALFFHLMIEANFADCVWEGITIRRGQLVTSTALLAANTGLSIQEVRTCLRKLGGSGEVRSTPMGRRSIITVCNYEAYQDNQQGANMESTVPQRDTIEKGNKEIKKPSNDGKEKVRRFVKPSVDEIRAYCLEKKYGIDPEGFFNYYESKGWVVGKSPMKDWKAAVRNWVSMDKQRNPQSSTESQSTMPSREEAMKKAVNPTKEEVSRMYNTYFLPNYPLEDGESREDYKKRIQPIWEREYKAWIDRRVTAVNNKY